MLLALKLPTWLAICTRQEGSVAIIFALTMIPIMFAVGAAVDYSRASLVQADLQSATDGAILSIGRVASQQSYSSTDYTAQARQAFDDAFQPSDGTSVTSFTAVKSGAVLTVEVVARVPLVFARILNRDSVDVIATAVVDLGTTDIEVALVLDNTGSMAEAGKMTELKRAAKGLIDRLEKASAAAVTPNIKIAIVPFDEHVRVTATVPPPSWVRLSTGSYYDENWRGFITDRDQPYDVRGDLPSSLSATRYPTDSSDTYLRRIMPLSKDFAALRTHIDAMTPNGATNTTIGLAWGLNVLTPGAPMSGTAEAPRPNLRKHLVFLTDGENTKNRWTTDRVQIDARTSLICDEIKKGAVTVHTIRLVEGNEALLRNCASDPSLYHSVTSATNLTPIFDKVADHIMPMRLSR
jgi:Flp pilus assembly protein TadG